MLNMRLSLQRKFSLEEGLGGKAFYQQFVM